MNLLSARVVLRQRSLARLAGSGAALLPGQQAAARRAVADDAGPDRRAAAFLRIGKHWTLAGGVAGVRGGVAAGRGGRSRSRFGELLFKPPAQTRVRAFVGPGPQRLPHPESGDRARARSCWRRARRLLVAPLFIVAPPSIFVPEAVLLEGASLGGRWRAAARSPATGGRVHRHLAGDPALPALGAISWSPGQHPGRIPAAARPPHRRAVHRRRLRVRGAGRAARRCRWWRRSAFSVTSICAPARKAGTSSSASSRSPSRAPSDESAQRDRGLAVAGAGRDGPGDPRAARPRRPRAVQALPRKEVTPLLKAVFEGLSVLQRPEVPADQGRAKWCALVVEARPALPGAGARLRPRRHRRRLGERGRRSNRTLLAPASPLPVRVLLGRAGRGRRRHHLQHRASTRSASAAPGRDEPDGGGGGRAGGSRRRHRPPGRDRRAAAARPRARRRGRRRLRGRGRRRVRGAAAQAGGRGPGDGGSPPYERRPRARRGPPAPGAAPAPAIGGRPRRGGAVRRRPATEARSGRSGWTCVGLLASGSRAGWPALALALGLAAAAACTPDRDRLGSLAVGPGRRGRFARRRVTPRERLATLAKLTKRTPRWCCCRARRRRRGLERRSITGSAAAGTLVVAGRPEKLPAWIGATAPADRPPGADPRPRGGRRAPAPAQAHGGRGRQVELATADATGRQQTERTGAARPCWCAGPSALYAVERSSTTAGARGARRRSPVHQRALPVGDNARCCWWSCSARAARSSSWPASSPAWCRRTRSPPCSAAGWRPLMLQLSCWLLLFFVYRGAALRAPASIRRRRQPARVRRSTRARWEDVRAARRAGRHVLDQLRPVGARAAARAGEPAGGSGLLAVADEVAMRTGKPAGEVMRLS